MVVTHAPAASRTLDNLATAWICDEWQTSHETNLHHLAHPSWEPGEVWALFEDLVEAVKLRDGVNDGLIHWTAVADDLTGPEPSVAAYEIACERVDEAARALLNGRKQ